MQNDDKIMSDLDDGLIRIFKAVLVLILLVLALQAIVWWISPNPSPPPRVVVQLTAEERRWIKARHQFHGVTVSIYENGDRYFIRDGKRCKL